MNLKKPFPTRLKKATFYCLIVVDDEGVGYASGGKATYKEYEMFIKRMRLEADHYERFLQEKDKERLEKVHQVAT